MLPQVEHKGATIPAPAEVAGLLSEYAAGLSSVLEETPRHYKGPAYLPTCRALRASELAANQLTATASALAYAGTFVHPVPGAWSRPVDLLGEALRQLTRARDDLEAHQHAAATPLDNRAGLTFLAEWLRIVEEDLGAMLAPVVALLGRVEP